MNPTVLAALIGAVGSVIGAFFGVLASAKLTNYKIEVLTRKVQEHNNLVTRTYELEAKAKVLDQRVKVQEHRMEDIEKEVHNERA